ncbi:MAG: menaquinone biosynthesis decarboxylase [Planctomycetales bacterium 4484_113]|nr:MAG: menaquinone biosynthesis decarboxylase [Planctomycetales bacterium 4484_113]
MPFPYADLREFISALEADGELTRVAEPVDPVLEVTELTDRMSKSRAAKVPDGTPDFLASGGSTLLFEHPKDSEIPIAINLFGSLTRISKALGVAHPNEIADRIGELLDLKPPRGLREQLAFLPKLMELAKFVPREVKRAPCQEIVLTGDEVELGRFPILKCWPEDGGRFITFPLVVTHDPESGTRNLGIYRMQVFSRNETGMHWHIHKDGARHFEKAKTRGEKLPVAVAIGADPVTCYAASAPLPGGIDELLFAGFIRGKPVEVVKCKSNELFVPASAEIVLEGYVDPKEPLRKEGPFGDHTGYYSGVDEYPTFHIETITHRREPIYHATIVGKPPQEDYFLGYATTRIFLPLMKLVLPELKDICCPPEGVFHNCVIASIEKRYPAQARRVMSGLWGMGQMSFAKVIVVVDADVPVEDLSEVAFQALANVDPRRDMMFFEGPTDVLDHAAPQPFFGSKVGIDATRKIVGECDREWPAEIVMTEDVKRKMDEIWGRISGV